MPNMVWCFVTFTGPADVLADIKDSGLDFRKLHPCPYDNTMSKDDRWYIWHMAHWGCKWTAYDAKFTDISGGILTATFETPNRPPYGFLAYLTKAYASLNITLDFAEEFDETVGFVRFENGHMKGEYIHPTLCKPSILRMAQGQLPWLNADVILQNTVNNGGDLEALDALPELANRVTACSVDMTYEEFVEMVEETLVGPPAQT
jgi:hypothetical protein